MVLVALIQSIVSAFHENLGPLNEGRGQETGEGANDDFLEKRGVHRSFNSSDGAIMVASLSLLWISARELQLFGQ